MKKSVCYKCQKRTEDCHGTCKEYADECAENAAKREAKREAKTADRVLYDHVKESMNKQAKKQSYSRRF